MVFSLPPPSLPPSLSLYSSSFCSSTLPQCLHISPSFPPSTIDGGRHWKSSVMLSDAGASREVGADPADHVDTCPQCNVNVGRSVRCITSDARGGDTRPWGARAGALVSGQRGTRSSVSCSLGVSYLFFSFEVSQKDISFS